jgi:hypothetical protein
MQYAHMQHAHMTNYYELWLNHHITRWIKPALFGLICDIICKFVLGTCVRYQCWVITTSLSPHKHTVNYLIMKQDIIHVECVQHFMHPRMLLWLTGNSFRHVTTFVTHDLCDHCFRLGSEKQWINLIIGLRAELDVVRSSSKQEDDGARTKLCRLLQC